MEKYNYYSDAILDRVAHLRTNHTWVKDQIECEETLVVPVWRTRNLITRPEEPRGVMLTVGRARELINIADTTVFLGVRNNTSYFAIDVSSLEEADVCNLYQDSQFVDLRSVGPVMDRTESAILAYAKGIMYWHERHKFCGVCGSETEIFEAGHLRKCQNSACATPHFPRTDPAVIMLVSKDDRALLGRKAEWMEGMYSTLAGFVEPGESLEHAVAREVMEEAGVEITNIRYHSSQPWPFPASLMLGFYADALTEDFSQNDEELEDLRWFTRQELADGGAGIARRPRSDSIARRLIDSWIANG